MGVGFATLTSCETKILLYSTIRLCILAISHMIAYVFMLGEEIWEYVIFSEKGRLEYGYLLQIFLKKLKNGFKRESYACKEIGIIIDLNIIRCFYTDRYIFE